VYTKLWTYSRSHGTKRIMGLVKCALTGAGKVLRTRESVGEKKFCCEVDDLQPGLTCNGGGHSFLADESHPHCRAGVGVSYLVKM
jgi:hypothetical protein